jgi:hypothetical protein
MAYEITWQNVKDTAIDLEIDLDAFTPGQQKLILDMATRRIVATRYFDDTFDARRYYAAHLAAMATGPAAGEGTRSSETIGSVSTGVTLAVNNPDAKHNLLSTVYGREFYQIRQTHFDGFYTG